MSDIKAISMMSVLSALIFVLSISFEYIIPVGYFATYVKPNFFEGILFITTFLFSLKISFYILFSYSFLLLLFKGISWIIVIEIFSLICAMLILILSFWFLIKKISLLWSIILSVVIITILMTLLNAFIITPTYLNLDKKLFSFYWDVFPDKSFFEMVFLVSWFFPIGGGILHGNIIKYTLSGILGYFGIKHLSKSKLKD